MKKSKLKNKRLVVANWKMNCPNLSSWKNLQPRLNVDIAICPPFLYLEKLRSLIDSRIALGAQNCHFENQGAYTGEISARMLKGLKVKYVIIGHSERRKYFGETDELISKKIKAVLSNNLTPILCIGETLKQRKRGLVKKVIKNQLQKGLKEIRNYKSKIKEFIFAYEPVWAIGTGVFCQPDEADQVHQYVRKVVFDSGFPILNFKTIYGGSVNSKNVEKFLGYESIQGFLVGGASLKIKEFQKIIDITSKFTSSFK